MTPRHYIILVLALACLVITAQASVSIASYGGVGDATNILVNTTSNSTTIIWPSGSFAAGDTNKLIEVVLTNSLAPSTDVSFYATITNVVNSTNVIVNKLCQFSGTNVKGWYGTWLYPAMTNAVAHATTPTDTILIPSASNGCGYLFVCPYAVYGSGGVESGASLALHRGGLTFGGQGTNATLYGTAGAFRSSLWEATTLHRGVTFGLYMPMTNDYPLVWTNLTINGCVPNVYNIPSLWDTQNHWLFTVNGSGAVNTVMAITNCIIKDYAGEGMEETTGQSNICFFADSCFISGTGGSAINNFQTFATNCVIASANFVNESYTSYYTNQNIWLNCTFTNITGNGVFSMTGQKLTSPMTIISGCYFANLNLHGILAGGNLIVSNNTFVMNSGQNYAVDIDGNNSLTYPDVSNIVVTANRVYNGELVGYNGGSVIKNTYVYGNHCTNLYNFSDGYPTAATNNYMYNNDGATNGYPYWQNGAWSTAGCHFPLETNNSYYPPFIYNNLTNAFTYKNGSQTIFGGSAGIYNYAESNSSLPANAVMTIINNLGSNTQLYTNSSLTGYGILYAGTTTNIYWSGSSWSFTASVSNAPTYYTLTVLNGTGSGSGYTNGQSVAIAANSTNGYYFTNWTSSASINNTNLASAMLTMPASNVTAVANFVLTPTPVIIYAPVYNNR